MEGANIKVVYAAEGFTLSVDVMVKVLDQLLLFESCPEHEPAPILPDQSRLVAALA
jgi:hypothetical protein